MYVGQKFVVIVDPGVPTGEPAGSYPEFEDGDVNGVWVLAADGSPLLGQRYVMKHLSSVNSYIFRTCLAR